MRQKKSKEIAKNAIDQQLDDIFKEDKQISQSSKGDADSLKLGEDRIKTIGEIYSSTDPKVVERAIKSLLSTSDDRFAEFDQVTVGEKIMPLLPKLLFRILMAQEINFLNQLSFMS